MSRGAMSYCQMVALLARHNAVCEIALRRRSATLSIKSVDGGVGAYACLSSLLLGPYLTMSQPIPQPTITNIIVL